MQEPRITKDGVTVVKHIEFVAMNKFRKIDLKMQLQPSLRTVLIIQINMQVMVRPLRQF